MDPGPLCVEHIIVLVTLSLPTNIRLGFKFKIIGNYETRGEIFIRTALRRIPV